MKRCACESLPAQGATPAQLLAAADCPRTAPDVAEALRRAAERAAQRSREHRAT